MADLGKCRESFQTPWNASYVLANGFTTTFGIVGEDLRWIPKCPKSTLVSVHCACVEVRFSISFSIHFTVSKTISIIWVVSLAWINDHDQVTALFTVARIQVPHSFRDMRWLFPFCFQTTASRFHSQTLRLTRLAGKAALHSLLRWIYYQFSLTHFSLKGWENLLFELGNESVLNNYCTYKGRHFGQKPQAGFPSFLCSSFALCELPLQLFHFLFQISPPESQETKDVRATSDNVIFSVL